MQNSRIEWTDHTFNPWIGCTKVSPGCDHCYAEREMHRFGKDAWGQGKPRQRTAAGTWAQPWKWDKAAAKNGRRDRVFCASLADILDPEVPIEWLSDLLELIDGCRNLDWLLLTKRPHIFGERTDVNFMDWPHVWMGTSIENQEQADIRIPELLLIPAMNHFVSCEPLLGSVDLHLGDHKRPICHWSNIDSIPIPSRIDWVIAGGESGPQARPTHPDWVYGLRDQAQVAGVPFFFKQWGEWAPWDDDNWSLPAGADDVLARDHAVTIDRVEFLRVGKKRAGRILDGRTWDEVPASASKNIGSCPICTMPLDEDDGGCVRHDPDEISDWIHHHPIPAESPIPHHPGEATLAPKTCAHCQQVITGPPHHAWCDGNRHHAGPACSLHHLHLLVIDHLTQTCRDLRTRQRMIEGDDHD